MATTWEYWRAADTYAAQHGGDYGGFLALGPQTSGGPLAAGQQPYLDQFNQWYNTPAGGPFQNLWQAAMVAAGVTSDPQYLPATLTASRDQAQQLVQQAGLPIGTAASQPAAAPAPAPVNNVTTIAAAPSMPAPPPSAPAAVTPLAPGVPNPGTESTSPVAAPAPAAQPTTPLAPGSQTLFGPIVGSGDTGLPQGLGLDWHTLFAQEMANLMAADGTVRDPRTGAPFTNPDGTPMQTQAAIAQAAQIAAQQASLKFQEAALSGTINGQPTLQAQQLQQQAQQFAQQMGLSYAQLQTQVSQFAQSFGLQQEAQQFGQGITAAGVTGTYNGAPTLAATQFGQQLAAQMQQFSGTLGFQYAQLQQNIALAQQQGDLNRSQQLQVQANELAAQAQRQGLDLQLQYAQLAQQGQQFGQTFGLQQGALTGQYHGAPTEQASEFGQNLALQQAGVTGYYGGAPTFAREQFEYQTAANPALAFQNELLRGATGQNGPVSGATSFAQAPTFGSSGAVSGSGGASPLSTGDFSPTPVRVPAVVQAFRSGAYVPTAGLYGVPSTTMPASGAALTTKDFQQQNLAQTTKQSPTENAIVSSFGQAGGVSQADQDYWKQMGLAKTQAPSSF